MKSSSSRDCLDTDFLSVATLPAWTGDRLSGSAEAGGRTSSSRRTTLAGPRSTECLIFAEAKDARGRSAAEATGADGSNCSIDEATILRGRSAAKGLAVTEVTRDGRAKGLGEAAAASDIEGLAGLLFSDLAWADGLWSVNSADGLDSDSHLEGDSSTSSICNKEEATNAPSFLGMGARGVESFDFLDIKIKVALSGIRFKYLLIRMVFKFHIRGRGPDNGRDPGAHGENGAARRAHVDGVVEAVV